MAKTYSIFVKSILLMLVMVSCSKESQKEVQTPVTPSGPTPYTFNVPWGFPAPFMPSFNPMTVEGVALGKALYSDPILSSNGKSCSTCHKPEKSYSSGIYNAPNGYKISVLPHINMAFNSICNWDGSVLVMDSLCMADFEPDIFNTKESELFYNLLHHPYYPAMFKAAFSIQHLDSLNYHDLKMKICFAITQYIRSLVSANTRYDAYRLFHRALTPDEMNGMMIFFSEKGDCFHCHPQPLFTDNGFHNNGLNDVFIGFDNGRANVTGKSSDIGMFHTPTLRNLLYTAPYMHDGRFNTLEEVIEFYATGVKNSTSLDPIMTKRKNNRATDLTTEEKGYLLQFLKTITDTVFVVQ